MSVLKDVREIIQDLLAPQLRAILQSCENLDDKWKVLDGQLQYFNSQLDENWRYLREDLSKEISGIRDRLSVIETKLDSQSKN